MSFEPPELGGMGVLLINTLIDFLFGLDIFINFRTTFYHAVTGDEISDLAIIRK